MTNTCDWNLTPDEESAFIKIKEALHRHPELSLKEFQTTKLIQSVLSRMSGVRILDLPIETGVVAVIRGGASGKLIGLRADIDGLPKEEQAEEARAAGPVCGLFPGRSREKALDGGEQSAHLRSSSRVAPSASALASTAKPFLRAARETFSTLASLSTRTSRGESASLASAWWSMTTG